ncbi:MAG: MFS transporter [Oscillospiraceae bacterium]|nr:MFS transporter [Oscillospiraceae bacterium]
MENKKLVRWPQLVIGAVVMLFAGIIYAWSILKAPFGSEFGWDSGTLGLNYTITICFFVIGGFVSGLLTKKTTAMVRLTAAAVLLFAGFFITSLLNGGSPVLLFLSYGVLAGAGIGVAYNTIIAVINAWFPDNRGLASGILLMAFGLTSLIFGQIFTSIMANDSLGWRHTFLLLAIIIGIILLAAAFLLRMPPKDTVFPEPKKKKQTNEPARELQDYTAPQMLAHFSFWRLLVFILLVDFVGSAAISFGKDIAIGVGAAGFAVVAVGILSVCNGLGRLFVGAVIDFLGMRTAQYTASAAAILGPVLIVLATLWNVPAVGIIGLCVCGFAYGCAPTISAAIIPAFYGPKNFALNLSILNLVLIPASFAAVVAGAIKDATGGFELTFIILGVCSVVGLVINLTIKKA